MNAARIRTALLGVGVLLATLLCSAPAPADVQITTGIRYVNPGTVDDCSTKAQAALNAYLSGTTESPQASGDWIAYGPADNNGSPTSSAVVRCTAVATNYVVTFTCAVETPGSPYTADALCIDVAHSFSGKPVQPLATPSPIPTGCTTLNLIGTWVSDSDSTLTLTMAPDGTLTDSEGVVGNWILTGKTATLTYYGNHTMTLSSDGKHLSGDGKSYTRKC